MEPMIDISLLRKEPDRVREAIRAKNGDLTLVDRFLELDASWRKDLAEVERLRSEQKALGEKRDIEGAKALKEKIRALDEKLATVEKERDAIWRHVPNLPSADTPVGKDESENQVLRKVGKLPEFDFEPKDHVALGESLGLLDSEKAGRVAASRFSYIFGDLVKLHFGLVQYALDILTNPKIMQSIAEGVKPGYTGKPFVPVLPPAMIRTEVFERMARLEPQDERYALPSDDLWLVGSAEHTLGPLHMDEILSEEDLPRRYVGYTTNFRREAGSYGKDTRGILRLHQFDKLEMESFTTPENSQTEQDFFVAIQEYLMWSLELPYQVVMCCTGDQGDPDARHIDIETWMPGQNQYRETHSADLMTDYQARRLNTRVRRADGRLEFVHMNDATVFSMRPLIAILENYQTQDGKVRVPAVLRKYVGKEIIG